MTAPVLIHDDGEGGRLLAVWFPADGVLSLDTGSAKSVTVKPGDLEDVTRKLCEAAGRPAQVMIGRPDVDTGKTATVGDLQVWREPDGRVGFMADGGDAVMLGALRLRPFEVRRLAAVAVAYADAADEPDADEPDPAEVEELAAAIRAGLFPDSERIGLRPGESDRTAARAALEWMRKREAHGG